ncbi:protein SMG6, partial [Clonorchis sinensis]
WYQRAQLLIPKNGRSYNQLAVLAVYTSRHLDAMYYYMRTLAASNPFATASQSLSALFNEIRPRAENLIRQLRKPKNEPNAPHHGPFSNPNNRFQRAEIWVHPIDGQTTVLQGARRLVYLPPPTNTGTQKVSTKPGEVDLDTNCDNEDDDDEDAQAELEEYANMSLIELSRQFGLTFIHAHGKLYTKIGMETFPEVASLALQAFSGLLAQKPCPLSAERLCQLCIVNMYNVDRAVSLTNTSNLSTIKRTESDSKTPKIQPISHLAGVETLRSVHHDHAARFALDFFSLLCRRTAQLLQEPVPQDAPAWWLPSDARLLLSALRLWSEWMILHPEHWLPPPNHRDPTLRPCLNDWQLIASLCTQAANWMNRNPLRPRYEELTPTTSMVLQSKDRVEGQDLEEDTSAEAHTYLGGNFENAFLFEEAVCAGFKPMLDLVPKMYTYSGHWTAETVADFVRVEKIVLFGDFLCGIDSPVLSYDVDRGAYEAVIEREMSERKEDKQTDPSISDERRVSESGSVGFFANTSRFCGRRTVPIEDEIHSPTRYAVPHRFNAFWVHVTPKEETKGTLELSLESGSVQFIYGEHTKQLAGQLRLRPRASQSGPEISRGLLYTNRRLADNSSWNQVNENTKFDVNSYVDPLWNAKGIGEDRSMLSTSNTNENRLLIPLAAKRH